MTPPTTAPIALVTGASRGLGKSMAIHLAERGVDLIITYRADVAAAHAVAAKVEGFGRKAVALELDIGRIASLSKFADTLRSALQRQWQRERFDYLVNNAGVGVHSALADTTEAQFDELMNIHLKGPYFLTQKLLPLISDGGRILNVSTGLTRFSFPGYSAYAIMKGGIEVLTRYLAKELGGRQISVNTIAPGAIETDFGGGAVRDNPGLNQAIAGQTALGRVGLPDDVGAVVASLLSPGTQWVNGQRIEVSGGMLV